jgi:hypothetical protein
MGLHRASGVAIGFALLLAAGWAEEAAAQPRRVKAKGKVVSVVGNLITILDEGKNRHTARPKAETPQIEIGGPLPLADIKPGMLVRLTGSVKSNELTQEVSELVIHSPADGYQLGIAQELPDQPATIVGQFVRIKDGKLTISVGRRRINAKLAKEVTATVESRDLRFVRPGDAIEIDSYTTNSGVLSARIIQVTLQPPKKTGEKKPAKGKKPEDEEAETGTDEPRAAKK